MLSILRNNCMLKMQTCRYQVLSITKKNENVFVCTQKKDATDENVYIALQFYCEQLLFDLTSELFACFISFYTFVSVCFFKIQDDLREIKYDDEAQVQRNRQVQTYML